MLSRRELIAGALAVPVAALAPVGVAKGPEPFRGLPVHPALVGLNVEELDGGYVFGPGTLKRGARITLRARGVVRVDRVRFPVSAEVLEALTEGGAVLDGYSPPGPLLVRSRARSP